MDVKISHMVEYDLMRELGRGNWVDAVAGEAMILGYALHNAELERKGAELAKMISEVNYHSDKFSQVEACAIGLGKILKSLRESSDRSAFIDSFPEKKNIENDFEYDFLETDGRYQIKITLYDFVDSRLLENKTKMDIEEKLCNCFDGPNMRNCKKEVKEEHYSLNNQRFETTTYQNAEGKMVRQIVIHNHQDKYSKGFTETFFFDDFSTAVEAWMEVKNRLL